MSNKPTLDEWNLLGAVEQFWKQEKHFPGNKILAEMTELPEELIEELLQSETVTARLEMLGIDQNAVPLARRGELKKNQARLSDKQLAVVEVIFNPMDKRSHTRKLESLGVTATTYNGWMSNKTFSDYYKQRASDLFGDAMPLAEEALVRKMMAGDTSAIKLYMEIQGRYNKTGQQSAQDFRMLAFRVIEILQHHIKDAQVLLAVSEDIKLLIEPNPPARQITQGEIIYDANSSTGT